MDNTELYVTLKNDYLRKNFTDDLVPFVPDINESIKTVGVFLRYFGHHVSRSTGIFEISAATYNKLAKNPFFVVVSLHWYVKGPKQSTIQLLRGQQMEVVGVADSNKQSVKDVLLTMPGLSSYISDYLQYWQGE